MKKVLILGKGKIGQAVGHYLTKKAISEIAFFSNEIKIKDYDLLIGALPGKIGEKSWRLALKYKKDLIDISDLDPEDYLKFGKEAKKRKITIIPECGFSPGLTNLICGFEARKIKIKEIEIEAGTISKTKFFFPFTWCFKDLILGHRLEVSLIKGRRKIKLPPFSGYRKEKIEGIEGESYLSEGLSSLPSTLKVRNMSYRTLRPLGFYYFYKFLENYGFFKKENIDFTRRTLENKKEDNLTVALIKILTENKKILWRIKSFSKKDEKLNSIQKIAGLVPAVVARLLLENKIQDKGILFMEKMGENRKLFEEILREIKEEKSLSFFRKKL